MTKTIETLIKDIHTLLKEGKDISDREALAFGRSVARTIKEKMKPRQKKEKGTLRMSNIGKPNRQLWYEVNQPFLAEEMHANAYMKFLLGDIIEEVILFLVEQSGHSVEGRQKEIAVAGVKGHLDGIIDGVVVDVKSASPFSFKKFETGLKEDEDPFGYRMQIQGYQEGLKDAEEVKDKRRGAFLAMQKVTGDLALDIHPKTNLDMVAIVEQKREVVNLPEPPERCYEPEPMGKSGNMKLGTACSYCSYKKTCWPGLRTFLYSSGPVFLTTVEKVPDVYEQKDED